MGPGSVWASAAWTRNTGPPLHAKAGWTAARDGIGQAGTATGPLAASAALAGDIADILRPRIFVRGSRLQAWAGPGHPLGVPGHPWAQRTALGHPWAIPGRPQPQSRGRGTNTSDRRGNCLIESRDGALLAQHLGSLLLFFFLFITSPTRPASVATSSRFLLSSSVSRSRPLRPFFAFWYTRLPLFCLFINNKPQARPFLSASHLRNTTAYTIPTYLRDT